MFETVLPETVFGPFPICKYTKQIQHRIAKHVFEILSHSLAEILSCDRDRRQLTTAHLDPLLSVPALIFFDSFLFRSGFGCLNAGRTGLGAGFADLSASFQKRKEENKQVKTDQIMLGVTIQGPFRGRNN